jgi:hypothetical protein
MWYSIICKDKEDSLKLRLKTRESHLKRINSLSESGRILIAGPNPAIDSEEPGQAGFTGSIIIAEFNSIEAAQKWAQEDPYMMAGVFDSIEVMPFKKVLP